MDARKAKEVVDRQARLASQHWGNDLLSEGVDAQEKEIDAKNAQDKS